MGFLGRVADKNALRQLDKTLEQEMAERAIKKLGRLKRREERILRQRG